MSPDGQILKTMGYSPDFSIQDFLAFLETP
jgi:hypothetical protein